MADRIPEIEAAIAACVEDLIQEGWNVTDDGDGGHPKPNEMFPSTLRRHFTPLVDTGGLRAARIAGLCAELAALEETTDG